jgi:hypothetical protein
MFGIVFIRDDEKILHVDAGLTKEFFIRRTDDGQLITSYEAIRSLMDTLVCSIKDTSDEENWVDFNNKDEFEDDFPEEISKANVNPGEK